MKTPMKMTVPKPKQAQQKTQRPKPKTPKANRPATVSAPVAVTRAQRVMVPKITRGAKGDVVVDHREYLGDINGSVAFANTAIAINPGLATSFPWLSQMAGLYESYKFERLSFEFQTESATTASGAVMMAMEYDSNDPPATAKQQLATYRGYVRSAPWTSTSTSCTKEDLSKRSSYYVRNGALTAGTDILLYDVGFLNIATNGQASTATIGELYINYRIRLMTPQLLQPGLGNALSSRFTAASLVAPPVLAAGNAPLTASGTGDLMTFTSQQPYQCLVSLLFSGTAVTANAFGGTATIIGSSNIFDSGNLNAQCFAMVNFTAAGQTLTINPTATTITSLAARFAQYAASNS